MDKCRTIDCRDLGVGDVFTLLKSDGAPGLVGEIFKVTAVCSPFLTADWVSLSLPGRSTTPPRHKFDTRCDYVFAIAGGEYINQMTTER